VRGPSDESTCRQEGSGWNKQKANGEEKKLGGKFEAEGFQARRNNQTGNRGGEAKRNVGGARGSLIKQKGGHGSRSGPGEKTKLELKTTRVDSEGVKRPTEVASIVRGEKKHVPITTSRPPGKRGESPKKRRKSDQRKAKGTHVLREENPKYPARGKTSPAEGGRRMLLIPDYQTKEGKKYKRMGQSLLGRERKVVSPKKPVASGRLVGGRGRCRGVGTSGVTRWRNERFHRWREQGKKS